MSCEKCGTACQGRYCKDSARDRHRDPDPEPTPTQDTIVRCTACGETYSQRARSQCPDCGSGRRRYVGDGVATVGGPEGGDR